MPIDSPPAADAPPDHAELVSRFQRGDRDAFTSLVRRWERSVLWIAYRVLGDLTEAEDVRQSVFLKLLESPAAIDDAASFPAWIRRATVNAAVSAVRSRTRRQAALARLAPQRPATDPVRPDQRAELSDDALRLTTALAQLDPDDRALLSLRFDEDLTFDQIAAVLDLPASTLKSRSQSAIRELRRRLQSDSNQDQK